MHRFPLTALALAAGFSTLFSSALLSKEPDHTVISTENIDWGLLNPLRGDASPRAADVWGDRTRAVATGMLVQFRKGFSSPPHIHNITYRGIVIEGLMHNDDPGAEKMWLPAGSFWTQPAGEVHITAADGERNLIYLEIDSGPYLVVATEEAFDNGERPVNLHEQNVVWLKRDRIEMAYLWGKTDAANGSFVKLPAGFHGHIENANGLKAVVVRGKAT